MSSKFIRVQGELYRRVEESAPQSIEVNGHVYRRIEAGPAESGYASLKDELLRNGGMVDSAMDSLRKVAEALTSFGELLDADDPKFSSVLSAARREDDRVSSTAFDLGDLVAQMERISDRAARMLRAQVQSRHLRP